MKYPFHQGLSPMSNLFQRLSRTATRVWAFKLPLNYDCSCWFGAFWVYYVITSTQPFSLIYRRRFLCLSSALLLACVFSQRLFAWPLLLRPDRLITFWAPIYLYYHRSDRSFEPIKSYTSIFSMPNTSVCAYVKPYTSLPHIVVRTAYCSYLSP